MTKAEQRAKWESLERTAKIIAELLIEESEKKENNHGSKS